jgi:hypothetical protein
MGFQAFMARWERRVPQRTRHLRPTEPPEIYPRRVVPCGATSKRLRSHTLGTRLGPVINLASLRFFVRLKGPFLRPGQPHAKHHTLATVNDRASDRDTAPKASLTVESTVLHLPS